MCLLAVIIPVPDFDWDPKENNACNPEQLKLIENIMMTLRHIERVADIGGFCCVARSHVGVRRCVKR